MIQIRWIMLVLGVAVLIVAIAKRELKPASISFLIGVITGFVVDSVLMNWHLREYPGPTIIWWTITLPCWGALSMTINVVWDRFHWRSNQWLILFGITATLAILLELPNIMTESWVYHAPIWLIILGWPLVVYGFRVARISICSYIFLDDAIRLRRYY